MKIAITVSQITPGGGITKYVCSLVDILSQGNDNAIYVITTHKSEHNFIIDSYISERKIKYLALGNFSLVKKYYVLLKVLRKFHPDLLINNYNAPTQYILPFLSRRTKIIHILHNNTDDFYRVASINAKYVNRWVAPTPALVKYFNEYTHQRYSNRIDVVPHGVELPQCSGMKNEIITLAYVGVLYEHKGVKILPVIIKNLLSKGVQFHFTIIGDGILRSELEAELSHEIFNGIVDFTGRISSQEVYKKLSETDIFVYPTHIDAFGLVIAEAMINSAVPVVTLLPGITDSIIDNGVDGFLVDIDNVNLFVEKIYNLINDTSLRLRMKLAAKNKAQSKFSIETMRNNYLNYISRLMKNHE